MDWLCSFVQQSPPVCERGLRQADVSGPRTVCGESREEPGAGGSEELKGQGPWEEFKPFGDRVGFLWAEMSRTNTFQEKHTQQGAKGRWRTYLRVVTPTEGAEFGTVGESLQGFEAGGGLRWQGKGTDHSGWLRKDAVRLMQCSRKTKPMAVGERQDAKHTHYGFHQIQALF